MLKRLGKVKQTPSNNDIVVQGHKETHLLKKQTNKENTDQKVTFINNICKLKKKNPYWTSAYFCISATEHNFN